jgi:hypothetical protein
MLTSDCRIVYVWNAYHKEFLYHWQLYTTVEVEKKKWWGGKAHEDVEEWVTISCYDDFFMARNAMNDYLSGVRQ